MDLEGEACGCGQSEASPSYLSLLQGSLNQGPAAVVSLAWQTASRRKSLSSLCSSPVWAAVHSCAHTQPHPLWPSACDSPVHLGRCCPVGKSRPPPPGCHNLLLVWERGTGCMLPSGRCGTISVTCSWYPGLGFLPVPASRCEELQSHTPLPPPPCL